MIKINTVKDKWNDTKNGEFSNILLSDLEVKNMLEKKPSRTQRSWF